MPADRYTLMAGHLKGMRIQQRGGSTVDSDNQGRLLRYSRHKIELLVAANGHDLVYGCELPPPSASIEPQEALSDRYGCCAAPSQRVALSENYTGYLP